MDWLTSLILGIVQGLTEFLPVSSSGHLELGKILLNDRSLQKESLLFTVVVHVATALSTLIIYRNDVFSILKGAINKQKEDYLFILKIIISMVPAALVGVLFNTEIEALFSRNILLVGAMLILTGALLLLASKARETNKNLNMLDALLIGISQALAIAPGVSRSGATISTSVLLGIDKVKAARFSFLMAVPLILGKMAKDLLDEGSTIYSVEYTPLIIGFASAFLTGLLACKWMIKLVKNGKLTYFAIYCFVVGGVAVASHFIVDGV